MRALIVLAHPEPCSFNGQLAEIAAVTLGSMSYTVEISDLCSMGFDPVEKQSHFPDRITADRFDVQAEQRHAFEQGLTNKEIQTEIDKVACADILIFQFPIWWFGAPAILKGWFDRVMVYGLYTSQKRYDAGVFKGKRAFLSVTAGGPESSFQYDGRNGDIDLILWPTHFTLHYMGFSVLPPIAAFGVDAGSVKNEMLFDDHSLKLIEKIKASKVEECMKFNGWEDWNEDGRLKPEAQIHSYFMRRTK